MLTFKEYLVESEMLTEAFQKADFDRAVLLIHKYLKKKLQRVYFYPAIERVMSGGKMFSGIRFFYGNSSIRLNFAQGATALTPHSVSFWTRGDKSTTPSKSITFPQNPSVATILPFLVDILKGEVDSDGVYLAEEAERELATALITEAAYSREDIAGTVRNIIKDLKDGLSFADQWKKGHKTYGPKWDAARQAMIQLYPHVFVKQGIKYVVSDPKSLMKIDVDAVVDSVAGGKGAVEFKVERGVKETAIVPQVEEQELERMTYEEQLQALRTGMKLLISNATNALFVSGRGGCLSGDTEVNIIIG